MLRRASTTALRRAKASIHQPHTHTKTNRHLRNQQLAALHATPTPRDDGFKRLPDHPPLVVEMDEDGVTPLVVVPDVELTLEWLVESPPPEHTWEEPPIFYDVVDEDGAAPLFSIKEDKSH